MAQRPAPRCVWPLAAEVGEGPVWSPAEAALWCVDIRGRRLHRFVPGTGERQSWAAPDQVGFVLPRADGRHIIGLPGRLALLTPSTGAIEEFCQLAGEPPGNRLNDACLDAHGRLWFGSMHDGETDPTGALYGWHGEGPPRRHDADFVISNGPAVSPDGAKFYHTDTLRRTIFCFDIGPDGGLSGKRPLLDIEPGAGWPDGTAIDAQGQLWVALWGGWAVRCYSPSGELLDIVPLPCAQVTKLAFGGPDLKTAFVTTAWKGLSPAERTAQPLAGGIFAFETEVPGLAHAPFGSHQAA